MTASTSELWEFGELLINDGVDADFFVESFNFTPAKKKPTLVANADADGEALVRESHYTDSTIEWTIRVRPQGSTAATLTKLGELIDAHNAAEKIVGGQPLVWTVHDTETPYTGYVKTAEIVELPITPTGDQAGWLIGAPVAKFKLTCAPFWTRPQRTILASTELAGAPQQTLYVGGVQGDVPAEAELVLTDTAGQDRRFASWGRDVVTSEANPALLLTAATDLVTKGFSGVREKSGNDYVIRASPVFAATTMFGTGRIAHVGSFAVYLRVWTNSRTSRFRISYRNGDGPLERLEWKEPPVVDGWSEIYMGEAFLDELTEGEQASEIHAEHRDAEAHPGNASYALALWPTGKGSARARGIAENSATDLIAYDDFGQAAGNLEGKEPNYPSGVEWNEVNKTGANGFKTTGGGTIQRSAVSDASLDLGCFALLGTTQHTTFNAIVTVEEGTQMANEACVIGLLGRYVNTQIWVMARLFGSTNILYLEIAKNVSGAREMLGFIAIDTMLFEDFVRQSTLIQFYVAANGSWSALAGYKVLQGQDPDLAEGGPLASGRVGVYDAYTSAAAGGRVLSGFQIMGSAEPGVVCHSGRSARFGPEGCLRQDSTGTAYGTPSMYRGGGFQLEPEGELGLINRVATRMRRNDDDVEYSSGLQDPYAVEVLVTERFLIPR